MTNDKRIAVETNIIYHYANALANAGFDLQVDDGGEDHDCKSASEAVKVITSVDEASIIVRDANGRTGELFFVLGNEPGEVLCDYSEWLEPYIAVVNEYAASYA